MIMKKKSSDADDDEMPEIRIYDKSSEGIFEKASYDDEGIISDFNNLPDEVDVPTNPTLRIHNAHPQSQLLGEDPNTPVRLEALSRKSLRLMLYYAEVLLQFKLQKIEAIGLFLAFASFMGFIVYQMDVKSAFLYGTIDEEVYVSQPPGFVDHDHPQREAWIQEAAPLTRLFIEETKRVTPLDFSYQCCLEDLHSTSRATKLGIMDPRNHPLIWKHSLIVSMVVPTLSGNSTTGVVNSWSKTYLLQCRNRLLLAIQQTNAWICSCCKIAVDKKSVYPSKTKTIEIRHHFIGLLLRKKLISVENNHTDLNVADLLTKPFDGPRFNYLVVSIAQYYEEQSPVHHHFSPSQAQAPSHMPTDDLLQTVPKLISSNRFNLESVLKQTKLTMGNAINSEDEEPEAHASGEEQEEEISPNTLEAAKTLSKVASLKSRSIDKGRRYKRRKESTGKKVVSSLDFQEDNTGAEKVNAASIEVNTASDVNTALREDTVMDIQEKDKNRSENNKTKHENGKSMRSQKDQVKVNKKSQSQILHSQYLLLVYDPVQPTLLYS
ncbi:putative ribonuclease H-like domain-containing protein [Tanacetum coccineum]|uniref:Ribonuclease H-like domain-containing protein n=1 Tax=Tanacetum coccineum TaxID=301880 RepID=A0ABQ4XY92_9ASTR